MGLVRKRGANRPQTHLFPDTAKDSCPIVRETATTSSSWHPRIRDLRQLGLLRTPSAVHLVAGSTTSSFFTRIARTILARPLVTTAVERFSCQKLVKTCIHSHPSILHRLFGCIRSVSENASCGVEHHGVNAQMPTYAYAQQVRTSSPSFRTRWLREFCTLH